MKSLSRDRAATIEELAQSHLTALEEQKKVHTKELSNKHESALRKARKRLEIPEPEVHNPNQVGSTGRATQARMAEKEFALVIAHDPGTTGLPTEEDSKNPSAEIEFFNPFQDLYDTIFDEEEPVTAEKEDFGVRGVGVGHERPLRLHGLKSLDDGGEIVTMRADREDVPKIREAERLGSDNITKIKVQNEVGQSLEEEECSNPFNSVGICLLDKNANHSVPDATEAVESVQATLVVQAGGIHDIKIRARGVEDGSEIHLEELENFQEESASTVNDEAAIFDEAAPVKQETSAKTLGLELNVNTTKSMVDVRRPNSDWNRHRRPIPASTTQRDFPTSSTPMTYRDAVKRGGEQSMSKEVGRVTIRRCKPAAPERCPGTNRRFMFGSFQNETTTSNGGGIGITHLTIVDSDEEAHAQWALEKGLLRGRWQQDPDDPNILRIGARSLSWAVTG
ncbi:hypothetical protein CC86DRAFT_388474 [Ophiobolus disseminans]|uniref:Uncharacterized protein n=1 Tax=Ophiobolus disseminans TaxID=1469910 RepID=A0A6A6ZFJ1_9PLEO|nr:hypothetical protein CC86DRAFT_388474 [Ophiobolus disseminans]